MRGLTTAKRLDKYFLRDKSGVVCHEWRCVWCAAPRFERCGVGSCGDWCVMISVVLLRVVSVAVSGMPCMLIGWHGVVWAGCCGVCCRVPRLVIEVVIDSCGLSGWCGMATGGAWCVVCCVVCGVWCVACPAPVG